MLLIDGPVAKFNDLTIYESSIQDVASALSIDLTGKLELAKRQVSTKVGIFLRRNGGEPFEIKNVVVTPELRHWLVLQALAETYRDAYHSELNDRYGAKWKTYVQESQEAETEFFEAGAGVVFAPVARPGTPDVRVTAGIHPANTYYIKTAWVNAAGEESAPSEPVVVDAPDGNDLQVGPSQSPANTAGWTIYVGTTEENCRLQTPTPLPIGQSWSMLTAGLRNGVLPGDGQDPEWYIVPEQQIWRG